MENLKVIFMGTPEFSVEILNALIEYCDVIGVVSQPDKKVGRKQIITPTPVKVVAEKHNIKIFQPVNIKTEYQEILDLNPDIIITCAYGQIVPKEILDYPKLGCINVHASLLPKLRGGAPIHKSIIEGYKETGITIMYMDVAMDSGDIISQRKTEILDTDNLETLSKRLSMIGKELLLDSLPSIIEGTNERIKQNESEVTYAYNIKREEEKINFDQTSREVFNQIRGLSPTPGAFMSIDNQQIKVYSSVIGDEEKTQYPSGTVVKFYKDSIGIATNDGIIKITSLKMPGKKEVLVKDYLNGAKEEDWILKKVE